MRNWPKEWTWGNHDNPDPAHEFRTEVLDCDKTSLRSDDGDKLVDIMDTYASDHDAWIEDFLDAWPRMQSNGYAPGELKDGPESSWLGYASLQGMHAIYTQFIF